MATEREKGESRERVKKRELFPWQISDAEKTKSHLGVRSFVECITTATKKPL